MAQLTEHCPLLVGLEVDGRVAMAATLRAPRLQDAYDAAMVVPVPDDDMNNNGGARVAYQMAIDDAEVLAQIAALEGLETVPPLSELVASIDPDDMALVKGAARALKKKRIASRSASPLSGEAKLISSPPASPST